MSDRNGTPLRHGDRVHYQVSPRLAWRTGTVTEDGLHVRSDYNGRLLRLWSCSVERAHEAVAA